MSQLSELGDEVIATAPGGTGNMKHRCGTVTQAAQRVN
jgi:hypothetical protein